MADIFISYARSDRPRAKALAEALEQQGYSVWWDPKIPPGKTFDEVIEKALDEAKCVVVLWSKESVKRKWVRTEASEGDRRKILVPALIEDVTVPLAFRLIQAADLIDWHGERDHPGFSNLVNAISDIVGRPHPPPPPKPKPAEPVKKGQLSIRTDPKKATIRLLNRKTKFAQGMELEPGDYHVEVSADGCETKRRWIELGAGERKKLSFKLKAIEAAPVQPEAEVADSFTNNIGMKFVLIPAGTFMMGSPPDEEGRMDEEDQHKVTISKPFYLQTTQVTQGQWKTVMGKNPSFFKKSGDDCPVELVSWDGVQQFISKLNQNENTDRYRLPTEAEWEYACRARSTTRFCFGDSEDQLGEYAWYDANSETKTHQVGRKKPNVWGLYDMHGNVWEWCQDWYDENYYSQSPERDPKGPSSGEFRVLRGGSWDDDAGYIRSADRNWDNPDFRNYSNGFRVARAL